LKIEGAEVVFEISGGGGDGGVEVGEERGVGVTAGVGHV